MASTYTLNSHSYQGRYMYLSCTQTRDVKTNTSQIDWTLTVTGGSATYYTTGPTTIMINGETVYYKKKVYWDEYVFPAKKGSVSGTITVEHDNNGDAIIEVSIKTNIYNGVLITTKGSWELDSNERFATLVSAPDFNDEESPSITYANPAGNIVTDLQAGISLDGSKNDIAIAYRTIPPNGASYTFTLTDAERNVLRAATTNANSRKVQFVVRSVIEGNEGYSTIERTLTIKDPGPTINPTIMDTNDDTVALTGDNGKLVRYCSNVAIDIGAAAVKQATLKSKKVTCGDKSLTSNGTILEVGTNSFVFTATDSRGNKATKTVTPTFIEYIKPTCILADNIPDAEGGMSVRVNGNYFNGTFGVRSNSLQVFYRYKTVGGAYSDWTAMTATVNGNIYSAAADITGLDYRSAYVFQAYAEDALTTAYSVEKSVKATTVFDWSEYDFNFNVPVTMSGHQVKELAPPTDDDDAVSLAYANGAFVLLSKLYDLGVLNLNKITDDEHMIVSGDDLNTYTTPGAYRASSAAITASLRNAPPRTDTGMRLIVSATSSADGLIQIAVYNSTLSDIRVRTRTTATTWGEWVKIVTEKDSFQMKNLWENASPGSSFAAQTLALDLSGYDGVTVLYRNGGTGEAHIHSGFIPKGNLFNLWYVYSEGVQAYRQCTVSNSGIEFTAGYRSGTSNNTVIIPVIVYGIKGVS